MQRVYDSPAWQQTRTRVLQRDPDCLFRNLGDCQGTLHVHHIQPLREQGDPLDEHNLAVVCARHHRILEGVQRRAWRRCQHQHRYAFARLECERRLNGVAG